MNSDEANLISREAIAERTEYFKSHPAYTFRFYLGKYLSQWADGTYASRQATLATFGGRQPFFDSLYTGALSYVYIAYCNAYQNLLYLGVFVFCLNSFTAWRRGRHQNERNDNTGAIRGLPVYLGMIAVFGGFLFHMLWEANSRYIFVYGMIMMLYAAEGLAEGKERFHVTF
jgi:hypothetical protein